MSYPVARRIRSLVVSCCALAVISSAAPSALAARDIPIGVYNLNGSRSQDGEHRIWAMRFVLDRDASVERLFTGFNLEGVYTDPAGQPAPYELRSKVLSKGYGAPAAPADLPAGWTVGKGRTDYGHGNGGRLRARLVPMRADGTPDLGTVLGEETFFPVERYKETKAEFKVGDRAGMLYARFGGVKLSAGTPYWIVYQNVDPNPKMNYVSFNSPVVKESESGPNGRNTLDADAGGAIMGLDPREVVAWSLDTGGSWRWGREVGIWGAQFIPGDYAGSPSTDDGTRLPWYAWQETGETRLRSNQPYMSYPDGSAGQYTLRVKDSPRATVLTEAGGYAPVGKSIGVVTVRNVRTGQTGRTVSLGTGIRRAPLDQPVAIAEGDTYEVTNTGFVWKAQGDNYLLNMGIVGPAATRTETVGQGNDRAELFAGPYVYDVAPAAPQAPAPVVIAPPVTPPPAAPEPVRPPNQTSGPTTASLPTQPSTSGRKRRATKAPAKARTAVQRRRAIKRCTTLRTRARRANGARASRLRTSAKRCTVRLGLRRGARR